MGRRLYLHSKGRDAVKRLLPQTLAGQLITLLLLALVASQALSFWFFFDERRLAVRAAARDLVFARTASIVRLLDETPPRLHKQILDTASTRRLSFWISDSPATKSSSSGREAWLGSSLQEELADPATPVYVAVIENDDDDFFKRPHKRSHFHDRSEREHRRDRPERAERKHRKPHDDKRKFRRRFGLAVSLRLPSQQWLNAETAFLPPPFTWAVPSLAAMATMALALIMIVVVMVKRLTKPMNRLAEAADQLGRGETVEPLRETGPSDVRRTTRAFDRMRDRLQRFVQDRTRMLAAISHDLRTPLTTLRLRAELLDDSEAKTKLLDTIEEMNAMIEATLAFAREEAAQEDTRTVDFTALVQSVCDDLKDLGNDVTLTAADRLTYSCRPIGLKRAIRNVIENAIRYGGGSRVDIARTDDTYSIVVEDDGPGIPEADLERVFEPFMRLDASRNKDSGGIGLGLSIVRSIVRSHGGDISLENRTAGGLRVTISLPVE